MEQKMNENLKISDEGLAHIKRWEGYELEVYDDGVGYLTAGVGHLLSEDEKKKLKLGDRVTEEQVDGWLKEDIKEAEEAVRRYAHVELTQGQFDSLVSFTFNVGENALRKSSLLRLLNAGQVEDAADEFERWVYAKGRKLRGLVARREAEQKLFLKGAFPNDTNTESA